MLTIKLYQFSKNKNSTKQPDNSVTQVSYSALMKTASSIINPVLTLKESPIRYNYCYIVDFERYYFINDITYTLGEWELSLSVDSLASFKSDLGNSTALVLRSASSKNGYIKDMLYPLTGDYTSSVQDWTPFDPLSSGYFYVNVIGDGSRSVSTYQMSPSVFLDFMQKLLGYGTDGTLWGTIEQSINNSVFNPINYISNCFWYPISHGTSAVTSVRAGNYDITLNGSAYIISSNRAADVVSSFTVGSHPDAATRGLYCNLSPFSEYLLNADGFGNINIPAELFNQTSNTVVLRIATDLRTGTACLVGLVNGVRFARISSSVGINVPLTQATRDYLGGVVSLISGTAHAAVGAYTGSISEMATGLSQYIGSIKSIASESVSTTGSLGSSCNIYDGIHLTTIRHSIAGLDNTNNGSPLCSYVQISTLSGYTQCEKGVFKSAKATESEINEINSYMVSGFYYE